MPNPSCVVIVPVAQRIEPPVEDGLRELERRGYVVWRSFGYSAIDLARSQLATQALRKGFEQTLWIDADILFHADEVDRLVAVTNAELPAKGNDAAHEQPGVISGVYVKKGMRELACRIPQEIEKVVFGKDGGFIPILHTGCGMLLVRKWVYECVQSKFGLALCNENHQGGLIPYFQPMVVTTDAGRQYLCEDYAFCQRIRECGIPIWADTRMRLYHIGTFGFSWEDAGKDQERFGTYNFKVKHTN